MARQVVVTGGAGRLGRYVVRELERDWDVVSADLMSGDGRLADVACDVLDLDAVRAVLRGADAVCHLAGLDYDRVAPPADVVRVNTQGTWNVLEAAAECGLRVVALASSTAAYGLFDGHPTWRARYLPVDEDHPCRPSQAYSTSKRIVEEIGRSWARSGGPRVVCLEPAHVVSAESLDEFRRFVTAAGHAWPHNYVTAADTARAFRCAIENRGPAFAHFIVSAEDSPLQEPTLDWYRSRLGELPALRDPALFERLPRASVFSSRRLTRATGWVPELTLRDLEAERA